MPSKTTRKADLLGTRECRSLSARLEVRSASTSDDLVVEGYASTFNQPYELYGGPPYGWTEEVDRHAFDKTLASSPDVPLLLNHEGMPLARTKSGTLQLSTDDHGLKMSATLDRRDPQVQSLAIKLERGDMDEMSFAFWVIRDEWNHDDEFRRLIEVNINKGDVAIVNYGANPSTNVGIVRAIEELAAHAEDDLDTLVSELRSTGGGPDITAARRVLQGLDKSRPKTLSLAAARAVIEGRADI